MAYNFLSITNEVLRRLNEVELTEINFEDANGFHQQTKDAVNAAIRDINMAHYEWPFNHVQNEEVLTAGVTRYPYPADAAYVDPDTFRIKRDNTLGVSTTPLHLMPYDKYIERYTDEEWNRTRDNVPSRVVISPSQEIIMSPTPDKDYTLLYEYFRVPVDLELVEEIPTIPERYRSVIVDGAMYHCYMFRSNEQAAQLAKVKFEEGVKRMRIMLINPQLQSMRDGMIVRSSFGVTGPRVTNG